jgi:phosphatidylinositol alpha-1,6-mannosyltransferase
MSAVSPHSGRTAEQRMEFGRSAPRVLVLMGEIFANGGIQRFNRTLLLACARLDVACEVLALNDSEASRQKWEMPASIKVRVFDHDKLRFARAVVGAVVFGKYDIIVIGHINLLTLAAGALTLRRLRPMRVLMVAHGIEVWTGIRGRRRRTLAAVDTVLSVSHYTARTMQLQAPELADRRFAIFPNALSESWIHQFDAALPSSVCDSPAQRFLLSVTRLDRNDRYKGIVTALEAFAILEDRSLHYVIAGRGDDEDFLQQVALRLQIVNRVHFVGSVSDAELARLYRSCAAFVLPSGKEGFGIVFLEAMYFGAPVIAAAEKGAVDVVQHGKTGLLVPYGDVVALKGAIELLLSDSALRDRIRAVGRETVIDGGCFTFQAYVQRLAAIFAVTDSVGDSAAQR